MPPVRHSPFHTSCRSARWLVLLTLALALLAPTLSQALALARGEVLVWSQLCRSSQVSPRAAQLSLWDKTRQAQREQAQHEGVFQHCPFCALQGQDLAPPPAPHNAALPLLDLQQDMPERFYSAPHSAHAWAPPQSRAPPLTL